MRPGLTVVLGAWAAVVAALPALAQEPPPEPAALAYPEILENSLSTEGDLDADEADRAASGAVPELVGWFAFKQRVAERTGITFGGSYGILAQSYSESLVDEDWAAGHKFTFNASAALLNRGQPNALHFDLTVEDRRPVFGSERSPLAGGVLAGSGIPTAATWGDFSLGVTQAYIRQTVADGRFQYTVGKV
ncbi:MAG: hypothetical protein V4466_13440, partial [Pseudomonadota bacterium]